VCAVAVLLALFAVASAAKAQEVPAVPTLELYGGYDYIRLNVQANASGQPPTATYDGNGGSGQLQYNANDWFSVLGSVGDFWATRSNDPSAAGAGIPYLFGPRVNLRRRGITPFAQVLAGGIATSSGIQFSGWQSHFAMSAGGGLDVRFARHFSFRPVQAEYLMTRIPDGLHNLQNNFRFSAGISLLLGRRS
jgi:opacity protein-like surface antigen